MQLNEIINYLQDANAKLGEEIAQLSASLEARQIMPEEYWGEVQRRDKMQQKYSLALAIISHLRELQARYEQSFDFHLLLTNAERLLEAQAKLIKFPNNVSHLDKLKKAALPLQAQIEKAKAVTTQQTELF